MPQALIGLGSNLPHNDFSSAQIIWSASKALYSLGGSVLSSPLYRSPAWPDATAPAYINAVIKLETGLKPLALLATMMTIEAAFGRLRSRDSAHRYAPRSLDLDLLDYDGKILASEDLTLPHPAIAARDFVLLPMADVCPNWRHPETNIEISALVKALKDKSAVRLPHTGV